VEEIYIERKEGFTRERRREEKILMEQITEN
jgi:hypothetical protein